MNFNINSPLVVVDISIFFGKEQPVVLARGIFDLLSNCNSKWDNTSGYK